METHGQNAAEIEIDLKKISIDLLKRWWIIVLATILGVIVSITVTRLFITPLYSSTVKMYVNNSTESSATISSADITAAKSLVQTYITIIRSDTVLEEVIDLVGLNYLYTPATLHKRLSAGALNATEVLYITVTLPSARGAADIANAIATVAPKYIADIVDGSSAKIVDSARVPLKPSSPSTSKNAGIGAAAGFILSAATLILLSFLDTRIVIESDLTQISGLPILGVISDFPSASKYGGYGYGVYYGKTQDRGPAKK